MIFTGYLNGPLTVVGVGVADTTSWRSG